MIQMMMNQRLTLVVLAAAGWLAATTSATILPVTSGLQFHVDASAITGLNPGDPVTTWTDLSGSNRNAVTRSGYQNPTYRLEPMLNGRPVVRFDPAGGNDSLQLQNTDSVSMFGGGTAWSVFVVFAKNAPNANGFGLISSAGNPIVGINFGARNDTDLRLTYTGGQDSTAVGYHDGNTKVFDITTWTHQTSPPQTDAIYTNRVLAGSYNSWPAVNVTNALVLGTFDGQGGYLNGDIAEILVYNRLLTAGERTQVEQYLYDNWLAVPEPSTVLLFGVGGALLWRFRGLRRASR